MTGGTQHFRMRLPATSANLGSGFDAAAVALNFHLDVDAELADAFSIDATGHDADLCSRLENNLILDTYREILASYGRTVQPLAIKMRNGIPLGMGCGSSAAGRLAAISLAAHFGRLGWCGDRILEEACALEGHPDNAAACWLGGFVAAANEGRTVRVAKVAPPLEWRAIIVLPPESLATSKARSVLPESYSAADTIANIQSVSMLGLAFVQARGDLLRAAMRDRIHQPYRSEICPLLPMLMPLAGQEGILGIALSGAGPGVLLVIENESRVVPASGAILRALAGSSEPTLFPCNFESFGAKQSVASFG
jgi:homoserine kinase